MWGLPVGLRNEDSLARKALGFSRKGIRGKRLQVGSVEEGNLHIAVELGFIVDPKEFLSQMDRWPY